MCEAKFWVIFVYLIDGIATKKRHHRRKMWRRKKLEKMKVWKVHTFKTKEFSWNSKLPIIKATLNQRLAEENILRWCFLRKREIIYGSPAEKTNKATSRKKIPQLSYLFYTNLHFLPTTLFYFNYAYSLTKQLLRKRRR